MNKYKHIRNKAVLLREDGHSLNTICKMLNRSKTTVYYWIKNIVIKRKRLFLSFNNANHLKKCHILAGTALRNKFKRIHEEYENRACKIWEHNFDNVCFLEFLMGYMTEGFKKGKWVVGVCNSDMSFMLFMKNWFEILNINKKEIQYEIQLHVDQNEDEVKDFWDKNLNISNIRTIRKSNSGKMKGRNWNSKYGVLSLRFYDAYLKTMINTWTNLYKKDIVKKIPKLNEVNGAWPNLVRLLDGVQEICWFKSNRSDL